MLFVLEFLFYWAPADMAFELEIDRKVPFSYSMLSVFVQICVQSFLDKSIHEVFCLGGASLVKM